MMLLAIAADVERDLQVALASFTAHRTAIERKVGTDQAVDLGDRLVEDLKSLRDRRPDGYTQTAWDDTVSTVARGDIEAIDHVAQWDSPQLRSEPGLHSAYAQSKADGKWEPLAVYIPQHHLPHPPIAIVIHGRPQTEMEILGQPFFRELADRTGTILVAPWGRGSYDFEGVATDDLIGLVPVVQHAYDGDPHRIYLVGYSMGGFTVFKAGTSTTWTGVMCIAGAILNSEVARVRFAWRDTPLYVVNGSQDESIPPIYGLQTAVFLDSLGVPTSFYQQPGGHHWIRTLMPQLSRAWDDMHHGVTHADSIPRNGATGFLPAAPQLHDSDFKP